MDRVQLIILFVVVVTFFVLGFFLGRWLHTLAPSLRDALSAAWDWFRNLFHGGRTLASGPAAGALQVDGPTISDDNSDATWCRARGLSPTCLSPGVA